jgi:glutamate dehydrogenase/leucine dehydrogenase
MNRITLDADGVQLAADKASDAGGLVWSATFTNQDEVGMLA